MSRRAPRDPDDLEEAREVALRTLTAAPATRARLAGKLSDRGFSEPVVDDLLDRLERVGLVDDVAYATAFVAEKRRTGAGRRAVAAALARKGVPHEVATQALASWDAAAEQQVADERASALRQRARASDDPDAARRRAYGALARRGFSPEVAAAAVRRAWDDAQPGW